MLAAWAHAGLAVQAHALRAILVLTSVVLPLVGKSAFCPYRPLLVSLDKLPPNIRDLRAEIVCDAVGSVFDLLHLAGEVVSRGGNRGDTDSCRLPRHGFVKLGDRDVESVGELFLQTANDLAAILERVRVLNAQLDGHGGDGHRVYGNCRRGALLSSKVNSRTEDTDEDGSADDGDGDPGVAARD